MWRPVVDHGPAGQIGNGRRRLMWCCGTRWARAGRAAVPGRWSREGLRARTEQGHDPRAPGQDRPQARQREATADVSVDWAGTGEE
jgi:hypothetical protein